MDIKPGDHITTRDGLKTTAAYGTTLAIDNTYFLIDTADNAGFLYTFRPDETVKDW